MLGNFTYHNATKVHFGKDALGLLGDELKNYGPKVMLSYGGGSIKRFGIYDQVVKVLREAGKTIIEDGGVLPNPDIEKVLEGARKVREEGVDLILAVGGGSTADYAKAVSASAYQERDPWDYYFKHFGKLDSRWTPVGVVLTMAGTGSEMNSGSVISSHKEELKLFNHFRNPDFAILNPEFTYTVPKYHMVAGIYDIMSHILEQYLSGSDDNTSDYLAEGLMRSLIVSSRKALVNPEDYEARSNIMWTATWALNTFVAQGKATDWEVHMLGQAVGAHTNATHGMTLAAVSLPYYRYILPYGLAKFARYAANVWGVDKNGKTEKETAEEGLCRMEAWMKKIGLVMNLADLGVTEDMLDGITESTLIMQGGYKVLDKKEIRAILKASL